MDRIAHMVVSGLAALGFAAMAVAAIAYVAREDIAKLYRQLPVAVYAKCPGAK